MSVSNIQFSTGISGQTLDALIWNNLGLVYRPALLSFVDYVSADYANYVTTLVERDTSGHYFANFPSVVEGTYEVEIRERATGVPLETDNVVGVGTVNSCDFISPTVEPDSTSVTIPDSLLLDIASNPQSITVDGRSISEHNLKDLIALQNHINNKASLGWGSIKIARAVLPGGTGNG